MHTIVEIRIRIIDRYVCKYILCENHQMPTIDAHYCHNNYVIMIVHAVYTDVGACLRVPQFQ